MPRIGPDKLRDDIYKYLSVRYPGTPWIVIGSRHTKDGHIVISIQGSVAVERIHTLKLMSSLRLLDEAAARLLGST